MHHYMQGSPVFLHGDVDASPLLPTAGEVFDLRKLLPQTSDYDFNIHIMDFKPGEHLFVKVGAEMVMVWSESKLTAQSWATVPSTMCLAPLAHMIMCRLASKDFLFLGLGCRRSYIVIPSPDRLAGHVGVQRSTTSHPLFLGLLDTSTEISYADLQCVFLSKYHLNKPHEHTTCADDTVL